MGTENQSGGEDGRWWQTAERSHRARLLAESMHEILNERRVDAVDDYHSSDLSYSRSSDERGGPEELKDDARLFLSALPDLEATIVDVFADGDDDSVVTIHYTIAGTHAGTFETIPPTDRYIEANGIGIAAFDGDTIAELSLVYDNLGMLQDLGLIK